MPKKTFESYPNWFWGLQSNQPASINRYWSSSYFKLVGRAYQPVQWDGSRTQDTYGWDTKRLSLLQAGAFPKHVGKKLRTYVDVYGLIRIHTDGYE